MAMQSQATMIGMELENFIEEPTEQHGTTITFGGIMRK
jgi:hypothetical protein